MYAAMPTSSDEDEHRLHAVRRDGPARQRHAGQREEHDEQHAQHRQERPAPGGADQDASGERQERAIPDEER